MNENKLPRQINVLHSAEQGVTVSGQLALAEMKRLHSSLNSNEGLVDVTMKFGIDDESLKYVNGHIKGNLDLICQRCMGAMTYSLENDFSLSPIFVETQAADLPSHYEPFLAEREGQDLLPLIEDEIIVALPIVAKHDIDECSVVLPGETKECKNDIDNGTLSEALSELIGEENGRTKE